MEYAAGEKLFDRISKAGHGRFSEDEAHFFFQQLISGVSYCHSMHISHLDLQLENMLLDGSRLKISCYPKSSLFHSRPSLASKAPEVLSITKEYDEKLADVWLCGIALDFMLVGAYLFHKNARYMIPGCVHLTAECRDLLYKIFVADPAKRITIQEIQNHPWFVKKLSADAAESVVNNGYDDEENGQSIDEIMRIIGEAKERIPAR